MSEDLYESDFYAWTQQQGAALRGRRFGHNVLEIDRLAEEIEELGGAQLGKARSFVRRTIEHLYKLEATASLDPIRHWLVEIINFRAAYENVETATIRKLIQNELETLHVRAARDAIKVTRLQEPRAQIDSGRRWTFAEVLGEADDPVDLWADKLEQAGRATPERPH